LPPAGSFPEEVCRRDAGHFLEEAGEVVRELEAQHVGGFVDIVAVHQEVLALFDHERVDIAEGQRKTLSYMSVAQQATIEKLTFFIQIVPLLSTINIVYGHSIIKPVFWYTYYGTMLIKIAL